MRASLRNKSGVLVLAIELIVLGASLAFAGPVGAVVEDRSAAAGRSSDAKIERLEALIKAQEAKIETLQTQMEQTRKGITEVTRTEEVRKVVRELMADANFRESLYPDVTQVGYDKGFYIKSTDEDFLLRINGFMKIRWTGDQRQTDNPRTQGRQKQDDINGFQVNDLYMFFQGYIHSPKLSYSITVTGDTRQANTWKTYTAYVNYEFIKEFQFVAGQVKIPFGRQWLLGKSDLQFIDRSLANEVFSPGRSIGAGIHGELLNGKLSYVVAIANGVADQDNTLDQMDTNFATAARLVAHLLGAPITDESDLAFSKDPKLEVGLSFAYNDENADSAPKLWYSIPDSIRSGRGIGGNGMSPLVGTDLYQFGADAAFRYRGFSFTAEYFLRTVDGDSERSPWELLTGRSDSTHQQGGYVQAGYFIVPKKVEAIARLGGVWDNGGDNTWEYTFGVNYFPWETRNLLIQADVTRIDEATASSSAGGWYQNDDTNMFRLQLQARF